MSLLIYLIEVFILGIFVRVLVIPYLTLWLFGKPIKRIHPYVLIVLFSSIIIGHLLEGLLERAVENLIFGLGVILTEKLMSPTNKKKKTEESSKQEKPAKSQ